MTARSSLPTTQNALLVRGDASPRPIPSVGVARGSLRRGTRRLLISAALGMVGAFQVGSFATFLIVGSCLAVICWTVWGMMDGE